MEGVPAVQQEELLSRQLLRFAGRDQESEELEEGGAWAAEERDTRQPRAVPPCAASLLEPPAQVGPASHSPSEGPPPGIAAEEEASHPALPLSRCLWTVEPSTEQALLLAGLLEAAAAAVGLPSEQHPGPGVHDLDPGALLLSAVGSEAASSPVLPRTSSVFHQVP